MGEGSFGKVYSAVSVFTEKEVAVKCFDKSKLQNENAKKKIFQEIEMLKKMDHPNVIKLLEVFENKKFIFFIMEYAAESDILKLLKKRGPLDEKIACYLVFQIIQGLKHCHSQGILHRDIKLDNVLLTSSFLIKIADFGVSKIVKPGQVLYEQCGTPAYIAPEVIKGDGYSGFQADIWNLGILLYAMVTGTVPFKSNSIDELHSLILKGDWNFPEGNTLSSELKDLLRKILVLDPVKRLDEDGILEHGWMQVGNHLIEEWKNSFSVGSLTSEKILKIIQDFGFPLKSIEKCLDSQVLNHIHSCYNLLKIY